MKSKYPTSGERIATLRKARGMSQTELGTKIKASQALVSRWECNDPEPHIRWLRLIAPILGVEVAELVNDEGC